MININRKIALSGMSILTALTMLASSAFAAFTTTATATGNTFSTTNPNLQISTDNQTSYGSSKPGFTVSGLVPGGTSAPQTFFLKNADADLTGDLAITGKFIVTSGGLDQTHLTVTINCGGNVQTKTVAEWAVAQSLGSLAHSATETCTMTATLQGGVGNTDANKSVTFDAVFDGTVGS